MAAANETVLTQHLLKIVRFSVSQRYPVNDRTGHENDKDHKSPRATPGLITNSSSAVIIRTSSNVDGLQIAERHRPGVLTRRRLALRASRVLVNAP